MTNERIAKFIASAGICSRREAEKLILAGQVKIDGQIISTPAINVSSANKIEVNGRIISKNEKERLWLYYKPAGLVTTHKDPENRPTVFNHLLNLPRVISIGRLDINSEGLLLLTNSGRLANEMMLPKNNLERVYLVRAHGRALIPFMENKTVTSKGIRYTIKLLKLIKKGRTNSWYEIVLTEGKNREVRNIFSHFGLKVNKLIRTRYGAYELGDLKAGEWKEVKIYNLNFS